MSHPISTLGAIHTLVSLVPICVGLYAFFRHYYIDVKRRSGKLYLVGLTLAVLTSFTVSSTGGLNPGHVFGVGVLVVAFFGAFAEKIRFLGRSARYLSAFALSFSFFLSLVPGTNETLSRLPVSHPLASGPTSPIVLHSLLVFFVVFVIGFCLQCFVLRSQSSKVRNP